MTFGEGDPFDDIAERESGGGGYTQKQALIMAGLYEYPKWTDGISSDEALQERRDPRNKGPEHDYNMQSYYQEIREEVESASAAYKWWTYLTSKLQWYGGICSILIMLFLIGGFMLKVFRQAKRYREELFSCFCGNFWISRLIQVCTLDSWKNGQGMSGEMMSLGGRKTPRGTPKQNYYAESSLDRIPCSQAATLLSSDQTPYSLSSSGNWTTSIPYPHLISQSSTNSSTPKRQEVHGVRPVLPEEHDLSRSPVGHS
jgi:hypothetical protein